jgi:WD40 repeat protein
MSLDQNDFAGFAFSPDSQFVAEASTRQHSRIGVGIHVLDLRDGTEVISFGKHSPQAVAMSSDGTTLAAGYWNAIALWNFHTGKLEAILPGVGRYVRGLAFSKDGRLLAAGTDTGGLQIWDVNRRALLHSIEIGGGDVSNPAFSPDGRLVAIGIYGTGTVFLIHVGSGKVIDQQKISDLGCGSVAFSPDGKYLIAPSTGGLVRWPYDLGGTVRVFEVVAPN